MDVEQGFHKEMVRIYEAAKEFDYSAMRFRQMVFADGGVKAAKKLLRGDGISEGLTRLCLEGQLCISMEALVIREPWRTLFTEEEIETAETRLKELGYDFGETG